MTVPALRRVDVTREVDLIEEVARIDGLEKLPATLPARRGAVGLLSHAQRVRRAAEDALVGRGLNEVIGWSFTDPGLLDRLRLPADHAMRQVVRLENPMSETQSTMRPTLLGSLLDAARHNVARNGPDVAIFESGAVYRAAATALATGRRDGAASRPASRERTPVEEHHALGALLTGALGGWASKSWRGERAARRTSSRPRRCSARCSTSSTSTGRCGRPMHGRSCIPAAAPRCSPSRRQGGRRRIRRLGFVGEVHPLVAAEWDLERTAVFAIDVGKLAAAAPPVVAFEAFASVPSLRQDLAVVLPDADAPPRRCWSAWKRRAGRCSTT